MVEQVITQILNIRNNKQISPKEKLALSVKENADISYKNYELIIKKLANIGTVDIVSEKVIGATSFMVSTDEFFITLNENIDPAAEAARLRKEKEYLTGFLKAVNSKLDDERFISKAKPAIVDGELKKKADAEAKLKMLEENLIALAD